MRTNYKMTTAKLIILSAKMRIDLFGINKERFVMYNDYNGKIHIDANNAMCEVNRDNFSFHTMEFTIKPCINDLLRVINYMKRNYGMREVTGLRKYTYFCWKVEHGVHIEIQILNEGYKLKEKEWFHNMIKIIVNPRMLIDERIEYYGIFEISEENIKQLMYKLSLIPIKIGLTDHPVNFDRPWDKDILLTRIDLCVNLKFSNLADADLYFKLMKRGNGYRSFEEELEYSESARRRIPHENAIVYEGCNQKINFYHKVNQLKNLNLINDTPNYGVIRFELQLKRSLILLLLKDYTNGRLSNFLSIIGHISENRITNCICTMFGSGNYYTLNGAIKFLEEAYTKGKINNAIFNDMLGVLNIVNEKRSLKMANPEKTFGKNILKRFDRLNINPVTIPVRDIKENTFLPSIPKLMKNDSGYI